MNTIHLLPDDVHLPCHPEKLLLQLALDHGVPLTHACGGQAKCSTCRVLVLEGLEFCTARSEYEVCLAGKLGFEQRVRLACQTRAGGPVPIRRLVIDPEDEVIATRPLKAGTIDAVGEEKKVAVLFSDIRNFTTFSSHMLPYDVVHSLNRHYEHVGEIISRHGGVINNYMGDGFLALFGLHEHEPCCTRAVQAGLEIFETLEQARIYFRKAYDIDFNIGIGIDFGSVIYGEIGHSDSKRPTVIGHVVNFASRIEAATKQLETPLLVSSVVQEKCASHFVWKSFPGIQIPGIPGTVTLHSPARPDNNSEG